MEAEGPRNSENLPRNLFADIATSIPEELVQAILSRPNLRIERIVSHGHASPEGFWFDQDQSEFVIVLQGAARLLFMDDGATVDLPPGAFINIPAHRRHRVEWTDPNQPTIWLAVHYDDQTPTSPPPATCKPAD